MKFRSCATLSSVAADNANNLFRHALDPWCEGRPDDARKTRSELAKYSPKPSGAAPEAAE
jgi:hypothetical protein